MNPRPARNSNSPACYGPAAQAGVGLIEVLIAVLVLSIGLLGVAALQDRALGNNSSSMAESMATVAAYTIVDAMRADRSNALTGSYNTTVKAGVNGAKSNCPTTTDTLAHTQLTAWCTQLSTTLGNASTTQGTISCSSTTQVCTVTITYNDSTATGASTNTANATASAGVATQTFVTQTGL